MTTSTLHTDVDDRDESWYDQACRLIETVLGGRRITPEPVHRADQLTAARRHKSALIAAVQKNCFVTGVIEACRVVEAVYPYLDSHGQCTDAAVDAAWNIIEPAAHTWPTQRRADSRAVTGDCLSEALAEGNTAVA